MKLKLILLVLVTLSSGCVTGGGIPDECAGWKPIIVTDVMIDAMSEEEAEDVLAHNEFGAKKGCWTPE